MPAWARLITSLVGGEISRRINDLKQSAVIFGVVGFLVLVGLIFLLIAGYVALADYVGALYAALIIGGGFVALGLIILGIWTLKRRRDRKRMENQRPDTREYVIASVISLAPVVIKSRLLVSLAIPAAGAVGAYLLFSRKPSGSHRDCPPPPGAS